MKASNNYRRLDFNSNSTLQRNNNISNATIGRLVTKFGDIVIPKHMKNLQNINLTLQIPGEKAKTPSRNIFSLSEQIEFLNRMPIVDENEDAITSSTLAVSLENVLRADPENELSIPAEMISRVAAEIVGLADDEPCGLRGCIIYISVEEKTGVERLARLTCDPSAVPTFEVTLTLKPDSSWLRGIKECWKKLKNKSVIISSVYTLTKTKLYRSDTQQ